MSLITHKYPQQSITQPLSLKSSNTISKSNIIKKLTLIGKRLTRVATTGLLASVFCAACSQQSPQEGSDTQTDETSSHAATASSNRTYRVVTNASYPPFEYLDERGQIIGFDVDLLTAIGQKEGFNVAFQSSPWTVLFGELENGEVDIIASSVWITDERRQNYGVSTPYFSSPMSLLTMQTPTHQNPVKYASIDDSVVAVAIGGENDAFFEEFLAAKNRKEQAGSSYLALQELMNERANYVSDAEVRLNFNIQKYSNQLESGESFAIVKDPQFPVWEWGFLVKKNNTSLLEKINSGLEKVKQDGTYDEIYQKWFDESAPTPEFPVTS